MSIPCRTEHSLLSHEEFKEVAATHHPAIYEMDKAELRNLQKRLRSERGKAQTQSRQKHREARAKAEPRGRRFPGTADQPARRKQIFANALKRVNREIVRLEKLEAKTEHVEAAHRALATLRASKFLPSPSDRTAGEGMQPRENRKRRRILPRSKVGSVLKANSVAQAIRDARPG